jgi:hypothetical protein
MTRLQISWKLKRKNNAKCCLPSYLLDKNLSTASFYYNSVTSKNLLELEPVVTKVLWRRRRTRICCGIPVRRQQLYQNPATFNLILPVVRRGSTFVLILFKRDFT